MDAEGEPAGIATAGPAASGFAGLLSRIQRDSYRTLRWLAWLVAAIVAMRFAATMVTGESLGPSGWSLALIALVSSGLALACTRERLPPEHFPVVAIGFEAIVGLGLAAQLLDWQNVLGRAGWPQAGVPTVGIWVVIFANVIPLPPPLSTCSALRCPRSECQSPFSRRSVSMTCRGKLDPSRTCACFCSSSSPPSSPRPWHSRPPGKRTVCPSI